MVLKTSAQNQLPYPPIATRDHEAIRRWVEARGGHPAVVEGTNILRIDFNEPVGNERLQRMSWEEFFRIFDERHLEFLYQ